MDWIDLEGFGHNPAWNNWELARKKKSDAGRQIRLLCTAGPTNNHSPGADLIEEANYGRPRMWAQYGDQSKGFCIILERERLTDKFREVAQQREYLIPDKVDYCKWLHLVNSNVTIQYGPDLDPSKDDTFDLLSKNDMLKSIYFKKSFDWEGEYEHRWLLYDPILEPIYIPIEGIVKAVVLGWKFPTNQISQIQSYCKELKCSCFMLEYRHPQYTLLHML